MKSTIIAVLTIALHPCLQGAEREVTIEKALELLKYNPDIGETSCGGAKIFFTKTPVDTKISGKDNLYLQACHHTSGSDEGKYEYLSKTGLISVSTSPYLRDPKGQVFTAMELLYHTQKVKLSAQKTEKSK